MPSIDQSITTDALRLVQTDRNSAYGPPEENLQRIGELWSAYLRVPVTAEDVSNLMVLVKISRAKAGYRRDNYLDGIGYMLLAESFGRDTDGR